MALKNFAVVYGRVALIVVAFAFVAGIVASPLLSKSSLRPSLAVSQDDMPAPQVIRVKSASSTGGQG
ncbi:hypothetical protein [Microvirga solisilvae]|uniref:hypothetical protein n=1 Tax=Microvirga solisilvae TaxID=2919498 RepID=UPI001FAF5E2E|nr:hypothetical protein [Microvirga solisilvae]